MKHSTRRKLFFLSSVFGSASHLRFPLVSFGEQSAELRLRQPADSYLRVSGFGLPAKFS